MRVSNCCGYEILAFIHFLIERNLLLLILFALNQYFYTRGDWPIEITEIDHVTRSLAKEEGLIMG